MSKGFKRIFLSVVVFLMFLTGCSSTGNNPPSTTDQKSGKVIKLNYWSLFSGLDGDYMKDLVKKFNDTHPEIQVEMLNLDNAQYYTKLNTALLAKQGPDIAIAHADKIQELLKTNAILPLDDLAKTTGFDYKTIVPNIEKAVTFNDKHYAVPIDLHAIVLFYNKKILRDAGLLDANQKPSFEPGSEGFVSFLKNVQSKVDPSIMPLADTSSGNIPFWIWWSLFSQSGGQLLSPDMKKAAFNSEPGKKSLQLMYDLVFKGNLWPKNIKNGGEIFLSGKAAIQFNGVWNTGAYEKNKDLEFGIMPLPKIFDKATTWGDSHTFIIPIQKETDKEKQLASLKFMSWILDNGIVWAQAGHLPSKTAVVESAEFKALNYRSSYVDVTNSATYLPKSDKVWPIEDILRANFDAMMSGQATVDQTLTKAEKEANELLSKP